LQPERNPEDDAEADNQGDLKRRSDGDHPRGAATTATADREPTGAAATADGAGAATDSIHEKDASDNDTGGDGKTPTVSFDRSAPHSVRAVFYYVTCLLCLFIMVIICAVQMQCVLTCVDADR